MSEPEKPIFVIGCCNSGTTMLWNALKSHPDVSGPPVEGQDLEGMPKPMTHWAGLHTFRMWAHHLFENPGMEGYPGDKLQYYVTENDVTDEDRKKLVQVYSRHTRPGTRLCDKSPAHTLRARYLQGCFPDATFVGIVRDGYAVTEGIIRKRWKDDDRPQYAGLRTSVDDAAWQWRGANEVLLSYQDHALVNPLLLVTYEDLVESPKKTLDGVLAFCHLEGSVETPEFDTWRNDEQIMRISSTQLETITDIAEPILKRLGYEVRT